MIRYVSRAPGQMFFVGGSMRIQPTVGSSSSTMNSLTVSLRFVIASTSSVATSGVARAVAGSTVTVGWRSCEVRWAGSCRPGSLPPG